VLVLVIRRFQKSCLVDKPERTEQHLIGLFRGGSNAAVGGQMGRKAEEVKPSHGKHEEKPSHGKGEEKPAHGEREEKASDAEHKPSHRAG
jgi:hypothetical protein